MVGHWLKFRAALESSGMDESRHESGEPTTPSGGAEWLQGLVNVLRPDAVRILDFPHAIEHLTTAAQPVLGVGTPALTAWLDEQAHTLKHAVDGARQVLTAVGKLPVQLAVDPSAAAEARDRTVTYFTKRLAQVQYAAFQMAGYPIGSGSTESANKVWWSRCG